MDGHIPCGFKLNIMKAVVSRKVESCPHSSTPSPSPSSSSSPSPLPTPHHHHRPRHHHQHTTLFTHPSLASIVVALILILSLNGASGQQEPTPCSLGGGCFPPIGNLALGRTIQVNSTCMARELLCPFFLLSSDCIQCSPEGTNSASRLNDNDNSTFWVSEIGASTRQVALRLDFEGPVLFRDMTLVWQSVRPAAMTLERSCDYGETWSVYRYYALSCPLAFMMEDTYAGEGTQFSGITPICTSVQSELFSFGFTDALVSKSILSCLRWQEGM